MSENNLEVKFTIQGKKLPTLEDLSRDNSWFYLREMVDASINALQNKIHEGKNTILEEVVRKTLGREPMVSDGLNFKLVKNYSSDPYIIIETIFFLDIQLGYVITELDYADGICVRFEPDAVKYFQSKNNH